MLNRKLTKTHKKSIALSASYLRKKKTKKTILTPFTGGGNNSTQIDGTMTCPPDISRISSSEEPEIIRPAPEKKNTIFEKVTRTLKKPFTKSEKKTPRTTAGELYNIARMRKKVAGRGKIVGFLTRRTKKLKQLNKKAREINPLHNVHMELKKKTKIKK